jgi:hypothetical protein
MAGHLVAVKAEPSYWRGGDNLERGNLRRGCRRGRWRRDTRGSTRTGGRDSASRPPDWRWARGRDGHFGQRRRHLRGGQVRRRQGAGQGQRADRGGLQQAAFRGRKPRRPSTTSPRPTHGTNRRVSPTNSGTFARCGLMTFCQFTSGTFGNVARGTQAINHYRDALVSGRNRQRAVTFVESIM